MKATVTELTGDSDASPRGADLRRLLVSMTLEHGELGPVLVRPHDHFTTAAELRIEPVGAAGAVSAAAGAAAPGAAGGRAVANHRLKGHAHGQ